MARINALHPRAIIVVGTLVAAMLVSSFTLPALAVTTMTALAGSALVVMTIAGFLTSPDARRHDPLTAERDLAARCGFMAHPPESTESIDTTPGHVPGTEDISRGSEELTRLLHEQAALRRVATLVARGESPPKIFSAVAKEVGHVLGADVTRMLRYETDETATVVGAWGGPAGVLPIGTRWKIAGRNLPSLVLRKCAPARMDCFVGSVNPLCAFLRRHGIHSGVGAPILVDGKCWGAMTAFSAHQRLLPRDAETRICDFTDLVATAVANAQARAELTASRARIVAATDQARHRIERDLHDGIQQRLVSLIMDLRSAESDVPADAPKLKAQLSQICAGLTEALGDLRETARGIHPAILAKGGLEAAIKWLARRSSLQVRLDVHIETRLPETIEVAAYYVVAEALSNAAKYAPASNVTISADVHRDRLRLSVCDNGAGGADLTRGSGLIGLVDRIEALDGTIVITSPLGEGTTLKVELPITTAGQIGDERAGDRTAP